MTDIPKEALEKADKILEYNTLAGYWTHHNNVARYIADVSAKAATIKKLASGSGSFAAIREEVASLILPDPESDLLKEAREICAVVAEGRKNPDQAKAFREGILDWSEPMACTLAALKHRKDG